MFLRPIFMDEQGEGGEGSGGIPDRTTEFNEILDKMEAAEAAEAAEETPDAEPAAEETPEPVAEETPTPEVDESEAPEVSETPPEVSETPEESPDWLTDDLLSRGAMYHMTPEQMADQGSVESVEKAMLFIDNYHARQRELAMQAQAPPPEQIPPEQVPPDGQIPPEQVPPEQQPFVFEDFTDRIGALAESGYDDDLTGLIQGIHAQGQYLHNQNQMLMGQVQHLTQHATKVHEGAVANHNDRVMAMVDDLGRTDLFGTEAEFTDEHTRNAEMVHQEVQNLMQNQGKKLNPETVRVAFQRVFAPKLINEAGKAKATAVKNQSRKRMGRGATSTPREDIPWDGDPSEDPVLLKLGRDFLAANASGVS